MIEFRRYVAKGGWERTNRNGGARICEQSLFRLTQRGTKAPRVAGR